jgi:predicted RNA-binding Zn-ribbon protein involved in translation (DUF1610 family)
MPIPTLKNRPDKPRLLLARVENVTVFMKDGVRCAACGHKISPHCAEMRDYGLLLACDGCGADFLRIEGSIR